MFDINKVRADFPLLKNSKTIYLDNAATTYKPQAVIDAVTKYFTSETANSGRGDYHDAYLVDQKVIETRALVATFLNAQSVDEIVFTHGATNSLNMVASSFGEKVLKEGDEILLSVAEHASNTLPWFEISNKVGAKVIFVPLEEDGSISAKTLNKYLSKKTKIVSLTHISNVLGVVNDIKEIARVVHQNSNAYLVVDGAQSAPHLKIDVQDLDVDFFAFSGHKMLAPTGIGILFGKKKLLEMMGPYETGGGNNATYSSPSNIEYHKVPFRFEAGTLNLEAIYGLHAAITYLLNLGMDNIAKYEHELREYAVNGLSKLKHIIIYNPHATTGIITFNVKGVFAQDAATYFSSKNIALRSGQHCAKMLKDHLLENATVRASLYFYTSKEEIDAFLEAAESAEDYLDAYF